MLDNDLSSTTAKLILRDLWLEISFGIQDHTSEFTWLEMEKRACGLAGWKRLCDPHDGQGEHASREGGGLKQAPRVRAVHPFTLLPKITVLPLPFKLKAVAM